MQVQLEPLVQEVLLELPDHPEEQLVLQDQQVQQVLEPQDRRVQLVYKDLPEVLLEPQVRQVQLVLQELPVLPVELLVLLDLQEPLVLPVQQDQLVPMGNLAQLAQQVQ